MNNIDLVMDLQFGSTGKGLLCGYLATANNYDTVMSAWGSNAGHTFIDANGRKFIHIMLPIGIVGQNVKRVMIGPGSVLDLDILKSEIESCMDLISNRIIVYVHPHASVITSDNRAEEMDTMTAIGSTKKGVGAALCAKIRRQPGVAVVARDFKEHPLFRMPWVCLVEDSEQWFNVYTFARNTLVEGAQGFGLSIQHGFYPYTTSRDVTPLQIMSDCGIPFADAAKANVYGTIRSYPIRVANRFDENGKQVGWSGPHYDDQKEMEWSYFGIQPELTTVTKLPRRIFTFSRKQMWMASTMCSPSTVFLNFVNYFQFYETFAYVNEYLINRLGHVRVLYGVGPAVGDVHEFSAREGSRAIWNELCKTMGRPQS